MPGAIRANRVTIAGQVTRVHEVAKASGTPSRRPMSVEPTVTTTLFQV